MITLVGRINGLRSPDALYSLIHTPWSLMHFVTRLLRTLATCEWNVDIYVKSRGEKTDDDTKKLRKLTIVSTVKKLLKSGTI